MAPVAGCGRGPWAVRVLESARCWLLVGAPVAQGIEQRFPKPRAEVRVLPGASSCGRRRLGMKAPVWVDIVTYATNGRLR